MKTLASRAALVTAGASVPRHTLELGETVKGMQQRRTKRKTAMRKVDGKIALIADGNSGIGLATAKELVKEDAYVFITERRDPGIPAEVSRASKLTSRISAISIASSHRSQRLWCFWHPRTAATSPDRNYSWMVASRKCRARSRGRRRPGWSENFSTHRRCID